MRLLVQVMMREPLLYGKWRGMSLFANKVTFLRTPILRDATCSFFARCLNLGDIMMPASLTDDSNNARPSASAKQPEGAGNPHLTESARTMMSTSSTSSGFFPKRALVLTKFSRYEFEKRRHSDLSEEELIENLEERGSDYKSLLHHHNIHTRNKEKLIEALMQYGIETRVVNRFEYNDANIDWADVIFTSGGDGTFLMAASKVNSREKPVIGINSDPSRSVGYLCLPVKYTENFSEALAKLHAGQFKWMWRQRIRITLMGEQAFDPPVELHDQQLRYPEYRFFDCVQEQHNQSDEVSSKKAGSKLVNELPVRALNEVFVGESLSSRVSYYEVAVDNMPRVKLKSSGLTICTGTGSTSWSYNINKVTPQCVKQLLYILNEECGTTLPTNSELVNRITDKFNNSLIFDPSQPTLAYTIRDPVVFGTDFNSTPRGFAKRIEVRSRMFDACLVIDGGLSFTFNDGAVATFEIHDEDALKTISLADF